MPSFRTTRHVAHAPKPMFDLVADIERYPEFLPLCTGLRVLRRSEIEGVTTAVAEMSVGFRSISERFTTKVTTDPGLLDIHVSYVNGPFKYLENRWEFRPEGAGSAVPGGCAIGFSIDYEFRSFALGLLMGSMFDAAFRRFTEAFERRADEVYGKPGRISG